LYAELAIRGAPTVDDALAKVRRQMIQTTRIAKALGQELGLGTGMASELFRRSTQQRLEPQLMRMQANLLAATGKMRGWSAAQGMAVASAVAFENTLAKMSFHLTEVERHLEGVNRTARIGFAAGLGTILGTSAAASPQLFSTLTDSFKWLSAEIGTVFTPYVFQAARAVQNLARWFHTLSDTSKSIFGGFTVAGVGALGLVVGLGILGNALTGIITLAKSMNALWILFIARSGTVVAAHTAEAAAATVAAAAETRLATARATAAGAGGLSAAGGAAATGMGVGGKLLMGAGIGTAIYGIYETLAGMKETIGGGISPERQPFESTFANRLFGAFRAGAKFIGADWLNNLMDRKLGGPGGGGAPGSTNPFLMNPWSKQVWMGGVADAWKQAQLGATQFMGPDSETLKIQMMQFEQLQKIAANTDPQTGVGPQ
jgi:hypothetical protein